MTAEDWPIIAVPKCAMTDDAIEAHSDVMYLRDLLHEIWVIAYNETAFANPLPVEFRDNLDWATRESESIAKAVRKTDSLLTSLRAAS